MEVHHYQEVELHISRDKRRNFNIEAPADLVKRVNNNLDLFVNRNPKHKEYIKRFSKSHGLTGTIMLDADGDEEDGRYIYWDEDKSHPVQDWINCHDGRAAVLLLRCCNPSSSGIQSRSSIILVPNYDFSEIRQDGENAGETIVEMYVPGKGYIDSYTIDYELKQLKPAP